MTKSPMAVTGKIWLEIDNEKVLGPGRVELLERIQDTGSIRQAALQMKMSYRQAWEIIKQINSHFIAPIVISTRGGKGGQNAIVTAEGVEMIRQFHDLYAKFELFLAGNNISF